jgi:DNA polymerase-4
MMSAMRSILHLDLDSFFVSVEVNKNSALKGKPLIVGGMSQRGVVAACSYEARAFGIHSAMPMKMALRLCPQAIVLRGDFDSYVYYSQMVTDIIDEEAPLFEKSSIDEFYLDLSGMDKYFGCMKWSLELRQRIIHETGLPISFGLSINKIVSKVGMRQNPMVHYWSPMVRRRVFWHLCPPINYPELARKPTRDLVSWVCAPLRYSVRFPSSY